MMINSGNQYRSVNKIAATETTMMHLIATVDVAMETTQHNIFIEVYWP